MASHAQSVTFLSGDVQLEGYLVRPDADGPFPAVVVIHEIFGLNENIKDVAQRFGDAGYVALAVDLFAGRNRAVCMARFMAGLLLKSLSHRGIRDLKAALDFLVAQPHVDAGRLGAIGFCLGGSFAIAWACTDSRLNVIAPYYGMNPRPLEAVARLCPVVGSYPTDDATTAQGAKLDAVLDTYQVPHDIKIYPGAKHSFFNDRGEKYHEAAAQDAWQRTMAFFDAHIGRSRGV